MNSNPLLAGAPTSNDDVGPITVVSYFYAPSMEVGARRFTYLVAEWERLGMDVQVIAGDFAQGEAMDRTLPMGRKVVHCAPDFRLPMPGRGLVARAVNRIAWRMLEPCGWETFWIRPAIRAGESASRSRRGVVIGTMPPRADGLAAAAIARRLGRALILDYRDPWSAYPWPNELKGRLSRGVARSLERHCVARSQARVFNTPEMKEWFERYFGDVDRSFNFVIPNGLTGMPAHPTRMNKANSEIIYAGYVYMDRSLVPVLRSLKKHIAENPEDQALRVVVYGAVPEWHTRQVEREGLAGLIEVKPRVAKDRLDEALRACRAMIAVSGDGARYAIPGKMYEYLAIGRPIIALASVGTAMQRFVTETGSACYADPADQAAVDMAVSAALGPDAAGAAHPQLREYLWSSLARRYLQVCGLLRRPEAVAVGAPAS